MKRVWLLFGLALLATTPVRAGWGDMREGLSMAAVVRLVGQPLQANNSKGGLIVAWTYDDRGCVYFVRDRVSAFDIPRAIGRTLTERPVRPQGNAAEETAPVTIEVPRAVPHLRTGAGTCIVDGCTLHVRRARSAR